MALFIDNNSVKKALTWREAVEFLAEGLEHEAQGRAVVSEKFNTNFEGGSMRILFAADYVSGYGAMKAYHTVDSVGSRYLVSLIDLAGGELLALIDGRRITDMRTGAASGVVARRMRFANRPDVAVIGSGHQARAQLQCLGSLMELGTVTVYSPTQANREQFAHDLSAELGIAVEPGEGVESTVSGRDIVVGASKSRSDEPVIKGEWLDDCRLLIAVGNTRPQFREIDERCFTMAERVIIDTRHALNEAGELIDARGKGILAEPKLQLLSDLAAAQAGMPDTGLVVFKSVGTALQDLALASKCYEKLRGQPGMVTLPDLVCSG